MQEKDKEHNEKTKDEKAIEEEWQESMDKEFEERMKKLREQDPFIYD